MADEQKRNHWDTEKVRVLLNKAGRTIECSWGVAGVRDRKTGETRTVIIFNDDDHEQFTYAFGFTHREEVAMLCANLMRTADRIHKGEFEPT